MNQNYFAILLSVFCYLNVFTQQSTEVYLAELNLENDSLKIDSVINISNNEGYDNQPSFFDNEKILFSSTRNQQTDIALYNIKDSTTVWITDTPNGSEYSPLKIPYKDAISAIRLDEDGLQRLYEYDLKTGKSKIILNGLKVGYHVWYSNDIIVCTVLIEDRMDLVISNLKDKTNYTVQKNVGRSLHKIPNTDLISYISKENKTLEIKSLNPVSKEVKTINYIWNGRDDITWLSANTILASTDKIIAQVPADTMGIWGLFHQFKPSEMYNMSRMAISPNGKYIAIVSQDSPDKIIDKQVETFNVRDLEEFAACFSQDVVVKNFPRDTLYIGRQKLKENYEAFYKKTPSIEVKVASRIRIGSTVIDQEVVTIDGRQNQQVAVYETDGLIKSMSFIRDSKTSTNPEIIVQKQLDAYNSRDINGFLDTYSKNVKLFDYPGILNTDGIDAMRINYTNFFKSTADLNCEIVNRIVIGNIVIDEEFITANGTTFNAVAIYEVENGKIAKVTFVR
ncbi:nuclear transport factor 2 family protein [uncultured Maribacter sp.]|uniref:nuclear transport factor 2 family protein n=1 Tax=uncultured Maribacter sp. TaxID=431308 RepID=UPI0030ED33A3|tara:strand:- start:24258 stop:25781 length:1524 start_codon:yes stop_codon:yes gene_type:complete